MEVLILNEKQLLDLVSIVYGNEIEQIGTIDFKNGDDQREQSDDCYFNYQTVEDLLADCAKLQNMFEKDDVRAKIAEEISSYMICCANNAFMRLGNYNVRKTYLKKVRDHADALIQDLKEVDRSNTDDVEHLGKRAEMYHKTVVEYLRIYQSGIAESYSKWVKDQGWTFEELLDTYKAQLGFDGPFEDLEEEKKLQVYEMIIEASGLGNATTDKSLLRKTHKSLLRKTQKSSDLVISQYAAGADANDGKGSSSNVDVIGTAALMYNAGTTVWNIYSSDHKIEQGVREAVNYAAGKAGEVIGKIVAEAIKTELLVGVEESVLFVSAMGFIPGIGEAAIAFAATYIIGKIAGELLDMIFSSGGKVSIPYEHHCYVLELPNGMALAREIAYGNQKAYKFKFSKE